MISKKRPEGFEPKFEVAACFIEHEGEILFLQRHPDKDYGGYWNQPAGKSDPGETPLQTAIREVFEETGIELQTEEVRHIQTYYVTYPEYKYIYHTFKALVTSRNVVIKEDEAVDHGWHTPESALKLKLVPDEDFCIADFINSKP